MLKASSRAPRRPSRPGDARPWGRRRTDRAECRSRSQAGSRAWRDPPRGSPASRAAWSLASRGAWSQASPQASACLQAVRWAGSAAQAATMRTCRHTRRRSAARGSRDARTIRGRAGPREECRHDGSEDGGSTRAGVEAWFGAYRRRSCGSHTRTDLPAPNAPTAGARGSAKHRPSSVRGLVPARARTLDRQPASCSQRAHADHLPPSAFSITARSLSPDGSDMPTSISTILPSLPTTTSVGMAVMP